LDDRAGAFESFPAPKQRQPPRAEPQSHRPAKLAAAGQTLRLSQAKRQSKETEAVASAVLRETLALDPLDWWAQHLNGEKHACDAQTALDIAHDFARAGFDAEAVELLGARLRSKNQRQLVEENAGSGIVGRAAAGAAHTAALPNQDWGALPLVYYLLDSYKASQKSRKVRLPSRPPRALPYPQFASNFPVRFSCVRLLFCE
jgi:hypothetical protein